MAGDLRGIFLWLVSASVAIYAMAAAWHLTLRRTGPPDVRAARAATASRFLALATLLVGLAWLVAVMEPVHSSHATAKSYGEVLDIWWERLPMVAIGSALAAVLAGLMGTSSPLVLAFWLGMPTAAYAGLAWAAYTLVAGWVPPGDAAGRAQLDQYAHPLMTILTAFPVVSFAAGLTGALFVRVVTAGRH